MRALRSQAATAAARRRTTRGLGFAALAAAAAIPLSVATPAHADIVTCDRDTTPQGWHSVCSREPEDGDPGGVSGTAKHYHVAAGSRAQNYFKAKGENFHLRNSTGYAAIFSAWYYRDGQWYQFFEGVRLGGHDTQTINKSLSENRRVSIQACVQGRGCVSNDDLRS